MAKRKLSASQRLSIRRDLGKSLKAGSEIPEILRKAAKKYGISPETARWYLKNVSNGTSSKSRRKVSAQSSTRSKPRAGLGRRPRKRQVSRKGHVAKPAPLVRRARAEAKNQAKRLDSLNRLLPEYNRLQQEVRHIERTLESTQEKERLVSRKLRKASKRLKRIEGKLKNHLSK